MELEKQVCSHELGQKLQDLLQAHGKKGLNDSIWVWICNMGTWELSLRANTIGGTQISAFTVAELGDLFPSNNTLLSGGCETTFKKGFIANEDNTISSVWIGQYHDIKGKTITQEIMCDTEADCRAKLLIKLLKTGKIGITK